jgi:hypothetical protein
MPLPTPLSSCQEPVLEAGERLMMDARLWQLAGTSTASNALLSAVHIGGGGGHVSSSGLRSGSSSITPLGEDEDAIMLGGWGDGCDGAGRLWPAGMERPAPMIGCLGGGCHHLSGGHYCRQVHSRIEAAHSIRQPHEVVLYW